MTADAPMVNINAKINHSKRRFVITSIPWLILKKPTSVVRTHLEGEFDRQTDSEHRQKSRTIRTPAAAVMVFFPIFVRSAPRRIGLTPAGWFFGVGRVAAPSSRRRSSEANDQLADRVSAVRGTVSKSFNLTIAS